MLLPPMHATGADLSERLDVIPAQFRVIVTRRPKYACRACEQAVAQAPRRAVDQGRPADRSDGRLRAGFQICLASAALPAGPDAGRPGSRHQALGPGVLGRLCSGRAQAGLSRLRELILASGKIVVDETKAPVLDPGRGRVKQGYLWAVARDDRAWAGRDPPAIAYAYAPGRGPSML